jgi:hypothetical protein
MITAMFLQRYYASPNIIRVIKLSRIKCGHVACMGEMRNAYNALFEKFEG